jgi:UDP-glucose 4-epimerase
MAKILITGSSGTIGTRLFEKLLEEGYETIGFDKNPNKWHKNLNNLTIIGNLLDKDDIKKIPDNVDLIIHLAANARVHDSVINPELAFENVVMTYNILNFMRQKKIRKIIFSSSREVYGNRKKIIAKEEDINIHLCESPYAASKITGEALVYSYCKCYNIDSIVLRFSNVYGMYDQSERFVPSMIKRMKKNADVQIFGKEKILDFTYINDCINGVISCIKKFNSAKNNVYNISFGRGFSLIDIAKIIKKELKSKSKILIKKSRKGEVVKFSADISKAKKVLNYNPEYAPEKGLKLSVDW